jgi:lactose/L-arabinose transport system ATP-binding protein
MNFVAGGVEGLGQVVAKGLSGPVATGVALPAKGAEVTVGLRPQHLKITAGTTHRVELSEALGGVSYVHLTAPTGEKLIVERHDQISLEAGTMVGLGFDPKDGMLFDKAGARLR